MPQRREILKFFSGESLADRPLGRTARCSINRARSHSPRARASADLVVLDIETGRERGRAPIGMGTTGGMFCCPGFGRDVYVTGRAGGGGAQDYGIARVYVDDNA